MRGGAMSGAAIGQRAVDAQGGASQGVELILGGQRSGKSRRAEWLAQQWLGLVSASPPPLPVSPAHPPLHAPLSARMEAVCASASPLAAGRSGQRRALFIATASAHDDEMRTRIARHRADRAERLPGMQTLEEPLALAEAIERHAAPDRLLVIDCLTLWLANQYEAIEGFCDSAAAQAFLRAVEGSRGPLVIVSNEIGLGVVPMGREVRAYVDALGWLNQQVAARSDRVCLMAAGLPMMLKDERPAAAQRPLFSGGDPRSVSGA